MIEKSLFDEKCDDDDDDEDLDLNLSESKEYIN